MDEIEIVSLPAASRNPWEFADDVRTELAAARSKHPGGIRGLHEGLAVLWEEFEEVKAEVFKRKADRSRVRQELIQVAAMAQRMAEDLKL